MKKSCGNCKYFKRDREHPNDGECLWRPKRISAYFEMMIRQSVFWVTTRSGANCKTWSA